MRFVVVVLCLFLASCVSPKTAPQSFYGGVYTPGKVEFGSNGTFTATAGVFSAKDASIARKAAYARFMLKAKTRGYRYFEIVSEKTSTVIGTTFKLVGKASKKPSYNGRTYRVNSVKRLLKGQRLVAIKRPAPPKPKRKPAPINKPVAQPAPSAVSADEPLVIMAPEDITGSVRKAGAGQKPVSTSTGIGNEMPSAVSGIPQAVILRSY